MEIVARRPGPAAADTRDHGPGAPLRRPTPPRLRADDRRDEGAASGALHLTISVTPTFAARWLVPRLPRITDSHPEIELRILASDRLSNFQNDGVDIAVRYGRPPFGPGLIADLLSEQDIIAVCSPALLDRPSLSQALDIARFTLLHDTHDLWPEFIERALGLSMPSSRQVRFSQTSLAIDAAIAGQGLALADRLFVEHELATNRLVQAFVPSLCGTSGFYVVEPRKPRLPKACAIVRQWLLSAGSRGLSKDGD